MSELKPCPFCGSTRVSGVTLSNKSLMFREFVDCEDCGASTTTHATKQEAVDAWNTRHERTCHVVFPHDARMCSVCAYYIGENHLYCPHCGAKVVAK